MYIGLHGDFRFRARSRHSL